MIKYNYIESHDFGKAFDMFNLFSALSDIIYPECCGFCGREILKGKWICKECASKVPLISWEGTMPPRYRNMNFDKMFFAGIYDGTSKKGVLRFKKNYAFNTAKYFFVKLADNIRKSGFSESIDYVTFVPMSRIKKRQIGYDHAEYIAMLLSEELEKPMLKNVIRRKALQKDVNLQMQNTLFRRKGSISPGERSFYAMIY